MSKKGKVKRKLTFDLDIQLEDELYQSLVEHTGAGVEVLVNHYEYYKNNKGKRVVKSSPTTEVEKTGITVQPEDRYKKELEKYIDDIDVLFEKAQSAKDAEEDVILHIVNGEVLSELEYQKRVWRPHYELSHNKREEVSGRLYGTDNNELKRKISLEQAQRFTKSGVLKSKDSRVNEDDLSKKRSPLLSSIMDTKD